MTRIYRWFVVAGVLIIGFLLIERFQTGDDNTRSRDDLVAAATRPERAGANGRPDIISSTDDPATVVTNAQRLMLSVEKPYTCSFHKEHRDGSDDLYYRAANGTHPVATDIRFEVAAKDRYRTTNDRQSILTVGDEMYISSDGTAWYRVPPEQLPTARLLAPNSLAGSDGFRLPEMSGISQSFTGSNSPQLHFVRRQNVGAAEPTLVFEAKFSARETGALEKTLRYWIGTRDGLIHKTEEIANHGPYVGTDEALTTCAYPREMKIEPPQSWLTR